MKDLFGGPEGDELFDDATAYISSNLPRDVSEETILKLYGLYKQAVYGDAFANDSFSGWKPDSAKRRAWTAEAGKSSAEAKKAYVELANSLGFNQNEKDNVDE